LYKKFEQREKGHEVLQSLWKLEKKFDVQTNKDSSFSLNNESYYSNGPRHCLPADLS